MTGDVRLTPVDEQTLEPLLSLAVAETEPEEVMPPVAAPAGWSHARRKAFREFYRSNYGGLDGPTRTQMYAVVCDGDVVGIIRMARWDEPDTMETGMWLGRSARGHGIGGAARRRADRSSRCLGPPAECLLSSGSEPSKERCTNRLRHARCVIRVERIRGYRPGGSGR